MNANNSEKILDDLLTLIEILKVKDIHANIFLRPTKPIAGYMLKYSPFVEKISVHHAFWICLKLVSEMFTQITLFLINQLRFKCEFKFWNKLNREKVNHIFLSHHFGNKLNLNEDTFFGSIPQTLAADGQKTLVLMLNHSSSGKIKVETSSSNSFQYILLPRASSFSNVLKIFLSQLIRSTQILAIALCNRSLSPNQRLLLFATITYQFHTGTLANLIIWMNLRDFFLEAKPINFLITLEGHAYENLICSKSAQEFPEIHILAYQHAPIVMNQFGLRIFFSESFTNVTILTSGRITKEFLLERYSNQIKSIHCVGSKKANDHQFSRHEISELLSVKTSANKILIAPEGNFDSTLDLWLLALNICKRFQDTNFVFRFHPHLSLDEFSSSFDISDSVPENLVMSTATLQDDLLTSIGCIYRSSAVAIEGLVYGVQPICFNEGMGCDLDPINPNLIPHPSFSNVAELELQLLEVRASWHNRFEKNFPEWNEFGRDYFTTQSPSHLLQLLTNL
jgi:hypothetical protein